MNNFDPTVYKSSPVQYSPAEITRVLKKELVQIYSEIKKLNDNISALKSGSTKTKTK